MHHAPGSGLTAVPQRHDGSVERETHSKVLRKGPATGSELRPGSGTRSFDARQARRRVQDVKQRAGDRDRKAAMRNTVVDNCRDGPGLHKVGSCP